MLPTVWYTMLVLSDSADVFRKVVVVRILLKANVKGLGVNELG